MALSLPYEFDTTPVVKLILRGMLALLVLVLGGILYSLLISRSTAAAVQLLLCAAIITYFGRLFFRNLIGSVGTITSDTIVVDSPHVAGFRLAGPSGSFSIRQFEAVRVERVTNPIGIPIETQIGPHERVSLVGRKGTPNILVARTDDDEGRTLGNELAAALKLPYQEHLAPY
jgi:hypothetical protein